MNAARSGWKQGTIGLRAVVACVLGAAGCASGPVAAPPSPLVGRILEARTGEFVPPARLFDVAADARFVMLGERHDRTEHHRLQARVIQELSARGRRPAVAFEMLRADSAAALAGLASPAALREAVDWDASGWPRFEIYEPVFAELFRNGLPVVAADLPRATLAKLGGAGLAGLPAATRVALHLDRPVPDALRAALAEDVRIGHCGYLPEPAVPRMVDVQLARDAQLARALARAATEGGAVLIAGAGHTRRDWGVPWWLARREPDARVVAIAFVDAAPGQAAPGSEARRNDYVWYTAPEDHEDPCERFREQLEELSSPSGPGPASRPSSRGASGSPSTVAPSP